MSKDLYEYKVSWSVPYTENQEIVTKKGIVLVATLSEEGAKIRIKSWLMKEYTLSEQWINKLKITKIPSI